MNILHIISARGWGGEEKNSPYLAKKQIDMGHKAFFFIHSMNKIEKEILEEYSIPYYSVFNPERKNIFGIKKIIDVCKKENIDIIHTHLSTACYLGVIAGNYLSIPVMSDSYSGFPYYAFADILSFNSISVKDDFLKYISSDKYIDYKPGFIERFVNDIFKFKYKSFNIDELKDKMSVDYPRLDESKFIGFSEKYSELIGFFNIGITGRVNEQKGQIYFIEAMELLLKEKAELKIKKPLMFHIVGDGKILNKLKKLAKSKGLSNNIKFWGYQKDIRKVVNTFDICVSCSLNEPFGLNNLEYMLMKKPCIATNKGGIPEIFGDTNILIPPETPEKLKDALKTSINNPEIMESEAIKGHARAMKLFSSYVSVKKVLETYEKAVDKYGNKFQ